MRKKGVRREGKQAGGVVRDLAAQALLGKPGCRTDPYLLVSVEAGAGEGVRASRQRSPVGRGLRRTRLLLMYADMLC